MIYLSGAISQTMLANPRPDLGIMIQPGMGNSSLPLSFWTWSADNGCFAQGDRFDPGDWLEWLAGLRRYRDRCLFAVAPDVIGDAAATWERSAPYLPTIRQLGYKAALVAQDGFDAGVVDWAAFDVLFLGGTDAWKLSEAGGYAAAAEAKRRGRHVHCGRVNSLRRLVAMRTAFVDSCDGTYVAFGPDRNLPRVYDWLDSLKEAACLWQETA